MKALLLTLSLSVCAWGASAQPSRVLTLVSKGGFITNLSTVPPLVLSTPATFYVATNEAVRIVTLMAEPAESGRVLISKDGVTVSGRVQDVVAGPALVSVFYTPSEDRGRNDGAMLTLERWRVLKSSPLR